MTESVQERSPYERRPDKFFDEERTVGLYYDEDGNIEEPVADREGWIHHFNKMAEYCRAKQQRLLAEAAEYEDAAIKHLERVEALEDNRD
jgi:hypothetical protein